MPGALYSALRHHRLMSAIALFFVDYFFVH